MTPKYKGENWIQLLFIYRTFIEEEINGSENTGHLIVQFPYTQKQKGGSDCGVFAIAFALHAAMGHSVWGLEFDQLKIRSNHLKCLTEQKFTPFQTFDKQNKKPKKVYTKRIDVHSTCLIPDTYEDMVQCETCHKWFHTKCVGLLSLPNCNDKWSCSSCMWAVCETELRF